MEAVKRGGVLLIHPRRMDAVGMLEAASLLVPEGVATDSDVTVSDVCDYLAHDEWEVALELLQELGDGWTAPAGRPNRTSSEYGSSSLPSCRPAGGLRCAPCR